MADSNSADKPQQVVETQVLDANTDMVTDEPLEQMKIEDTDVINFTADLGKLGSTSKEQPIHEDKQAKLQSKLRDDAVKLLGSQLHPLTQGPVESDDQPPPLSGKAVLAIRKLYLQLEKAKTQTSAVTEAQMNALRDSVFHTVACIRGSEVDTTKITTAEELLREFRREKIYKKLQQDRKLEKAGDAEEHSDMEVDATDEDGNLQDEDEFEDDAEDEAEL